MAFEVSPAFGCLLFSGIIKENKFVCVSSQDILFGKKKLMGLDFIFDLRNDKDSGLLSNG